MKKRFDDWIEVKGGLHRTAIVRRIKEGEIWWCAIGENVGVEINGKSKTFARPVVVLRKLNKRSFMAIPLTSKEHFGSWYVDFGFRGMKEYAVLSQARTISAMRLYERIGRVNEIDMLKIKHGFHRLYCE